MTHLGDRKSTALNGICAYFTMFPLEFPYRVIDRWSSRRGWVIDPFCGRGTTNYAARLLGMPSIGVDSSPVAVSLAQAKLVNASVNDIVRTAADVLDDVPHPSSVPGGEFWERAFHPDVLQTVCRLREGLLSDCKSDGRRALRAILLGALHGPRNKHGSSYLSNQSPRTFAPKPRYAVKFWRERNLAPPFVNVLQIIEQRAHRYYGQEQTRGRGVAVLGDSRECEVFRQFHEHARVRWVITSPPYYGMRTYIPDQWLRSWFVGGTSEVDYSNIGQIAHSSPREFIAQLKQVWVNVGSICESDANLVVRFGGINDRKADPLELLVCSLEHTGWTITGLTSAGTASLGRRQARQILRPTGQALQEYDVWATWKGHA